MERIVFSPEELLKNDEAIPEGTLKIVWVGSRGYVQAIVEETAWANPIVQQKYDEMAEYRLSHV